MPPERPPDTTADVLERAAAVRRDSQALLRQVRGRGLLVPRNMSKAMLRNRLRAVLLEGEVGGSRGKALLAAVALEAVHRLGLDARRPADIRNDPRLVLEAEIAVRYFLMELLNRVGDEAYNEAWGVEGWQVAQRLMERAEVATYVCERVLGMLGREDLAGERVVEMGVGNGTACLPYVARGAHVVGYDASDAMVERAGRIPNVSARKGNPNVPGAPYGEIEDGSVLVHLLMGVNRYLSNEAQDRLFADIARTLREDGLFVAGLWPSERAAAVNLWGKTHRTYPWQYEEALWGHGLLVEHADWVVHGEGDFFPAWVLYVRGMLPGELSRTRAGQRPARTDFRRLAKKRLDSNRYGEQVRRAREVVARLGDGPPGSSTPS